MYNATKPPYGSENLHYKWNKYDHDTEADCGFDKGLEPIIKRKDQNLYN